MAEYIGAEDIARALGLPVEVVRGVLEGTVAESDLRGFEPRRGSEIRVVAKERFLRSRVIAVVSPGGCGGTTLAAAMGVAAARSGVRTVVVDLNEFASVGPALGLDVWGEDAVGYPNVLSWRSGVDEVEVEHPEIRGLFVVFGAETAERHNALEFETVREMLRILPRRWGCVVVDCPSSPRLWPYVLPECDVLLFVLRRDSSAVRAFLEALPAVRSLFLAERCMAVFGCPGPLSEADCRRAVAREAGVPVLGVLPAVERMNFAVVRDPKHPYAAEARRIAAHFLGGEVASETPGARRRLFGR
ncbi:MAG: hypothetical protein ACPLRW_07435 [Moorellales bacterium]